VDDILKNKTKHKYREDIYFCDKGNITILLMFWDIRYIIHKHVLS